MNTKVICGFVILMLMLSSCQKVEDDVPSSSQNDARYSRLYIVGRDDTNGVICYGNKNTNAALSCVKVR